ncbi:hypothetical protein [Vibrio harveyi]|uniref:hypothetical protein n=1 Tax=Vibrio harveyi TaxID=669 RepID=UPI002380095D|nr:hypothetical protein [Vibrio harveyi]
MSINKDSRSIKRYYAEANSNIKDVKLVKVISEFIEINSVQIDTLNSLTDDKMKAGLFESFFSNVSKRKDLISNLWITFQEKELNLPKTGSSIKRFFDYCNEEYSEEAIENEKINSDLFKCKQEIKADKRQAVTEQVEAIMEAFDERIDKASTADALLALKNKPVKEVLEITAKKTKAKRVAPKKVNEKPVQDEQQAPVQAENEAPASSFSNRIDD